jgi:hypothetical protein
MAQVDQWLNGIGLGEYTDLFAVHDIDVDVLADLTEADLEGIGISLGHRKRLLKAIAALSAGPPPAEAAVADATSQALAAAPGDNS